MTVSKNTAFHEAGHVVALIVLDIPFRQVRAHAAQQQDGSLSAGAAEGVRFGEDQNREKRIVALAGSVSEAIASWDQVLAMRGGKQNSTLPGSPAALAGKWLKNKNVDDRKAYEAACATDTDITAELAYVEAFLRQNWAKVERVAKALMEGSLLDREAGLCGADTGA